MNALFKSCAIATSLAVSSLLQTLALAVDSADVEACMQTFTQAYFPNSHATYAAPERPEVLLPLALNKGTHNVAVSVTSAKTGRVVASGVCAVSDVPARPGYVIVSETEQK